MNVKQCLYLWIFVSFLKKTCAIVNAHEEGKRHFECYPRTVDNFGSTADNGVNSQTKTQIVSTVKPKWFEISKRNTTENIFKEYVTIHWADPTSVLHDATLFLQCNRLLLARACFNEQQCGFRTRSQRHTSVTKHWANQINWNCWQGKSRVKVRNDSLARDLWTEWLESVSVLVFVRSSYVLGGLWPSREKYMAPHTNRQAPVPRPPPKSKQTLSKKDPTDFSLSHVNCVFAAKEKTKATMKARIRKSLGFRVFYNKHIPGAVFSMSKLECTHSKTLMSLR